MGWFYQHRGKGTSIKEFFETEFNFENEKKSSKVLDCKTVKLRTAYIALEHTVKATGDRKVFAIACMLDYQPLDAYNFGYKPVDEDMGPTADECPESILRLLTPTNLLYTGQSKTWAESWRGRCWDRINARKNFPLTKGKKFRTTEPVKFTTGHEYNEFVVVKRNRYRGLHAGIIVSTSMFRFDPHNYGPLQEIE